MLLRLLHRILLIAFVVIAPTSCEMSGDDLVPQSSEVGECAILYASYDGEEATRVDGTLWESGDFIGVKTSDSEDDDNMCFSVEPNGLMSNTDESANAIFATDSKDYYAYYPYYSELSSDNTIAVDLTDQRNKSLSTLDLMWAKQEGVGLYQPTIYLLFSRQLVHLNISICIKDGSFDEDQGITLRGVSVGGSFNITTGELTSSDIRENLKITPSSTNTVTLADGTTIMTLSAEALVMPMSGESISIVFYNDAGEAVMWSTTPTWSKGSSYNYTVSNGCKSYSLSSISSNDITNGDLVVINDWSATTAGSFEDLRTALSGKSDITLHIANLTALPSSALKDCTAITRLSMPAMESIGSYAISGCSSLETLYSTNLEYIGGYGFSGCSSLLSITAPNLYMVGDGAFSGCGLGMFSCDNVVNIGDDAFNGCSSMTSFYAPNLAWVGKTALSGCSALTKVTIGVSADSVTNLEYSWIDSADTDDIALTISPILPSGLSVSGDTLSYSSGSSYTFDSITNESLMLSSFDDSTDLATLTSGEWTIMDSSISSADDFAGLRTVLAKLSEPISLVFPKLTTLPQNALSNTSGFDSITLMSISEIGAASLDGCGSLRSIVLGSSGNNITSIDSGWIGSSECEDIELTISGLISSTMSYLRNKLTYADATEVRFKTINSVGYYLSDFDITTLPTSLEWVISDSEAADSDAFSDLRSVLSSVTSEEGISLIFSDLDKLPRYALSEASSIKRVTLSKATRVYYGALSMIESLEEVYMPMVTTLSDYIFASDIFADKHSLRSVSMPSAMVIGADLFQFCIAMESLDLGSTASNIVSLDSDCFSSLSTANIDLTINNNLPSGVSIKDNTISLSDGAAVYSYTFKSITQK